MPEVSTVVEEFTNSSMNNQRKKVAPVSSVKKPASRVAIERSLESIGKQETINQ